MFAATADPFPSNVFVANGVLGVPDVVCVPSVAYGNPAVAGVQSVAGDCLLLAFLLILTSLLPFCC